MQRINSLACLLNIFSGGIRKKFIDNFHQVAIDDVPSDDFHHFLADLSHLRQKLSFYSIRPKIQFLTSFLMKGSLSDILFASLGNNELSSCMCQSELSVSS